MAYDLDLFVNVTSKNGQAYDDVPQELFESAFEFDTINSQAVPVFVYELNGEPVAWYDDEFCRGVVVQNS